MKYLVVFALCLVLLVGCATLPTEIDGAINDLPYEMKQGMQMGIGELWTSQYASELWNASELVVIGRFLDIAPEPGEWNQYHYLSLEALVYQFQVVEVLRGETMQNVLPIGLCYGRLSDGEIVRSQSYVQPDADSYKLLFLTQPEDWESDYYVITGSVAWYTTDRLEMPAEENWKELMFYPDGWVGDDTVLYMDLLYPSTTVCRPKLTGKELRQLKKLDGADVETVKRPIDQLPYPVLGPSDIDLDYWGTQYLSGAFKAADHVIIGRFLDIAPKSIDLTSGEENRKAWEYLEYQFEIAAVLKGDITQPQIGASIIHGTSGRDYTLSFDIYRYPDANSYKVLFLHEYGTEERPVYNVIGAKWLSTALSNEPMETYDWQSAAFYPQMRQPWEARMYYDLIDPETTESYAPITGAELLALAE